MGDYEDSKEGEEEGSVMKKTLFRWNFLAN